MTIPTLRTFRCTEYAAVLTPLSCASRHVAASRSYRAGTESPWHLTACKTCRIGKAHRARWMGYEGFDVTQEPDRVHPGAAIGRLLKQALNEQGLAHLRAALDEPSPEGAARRDGAA